MEPATHTPLTFAEGAIAEGAIAEGSIAELAESEALPPSWPTLSEHRGFQMNSCASLLFSFFSATGHAALVRLKRYAATPMTLDRQLGQLVLDWIEKKDITRIAKWIDPSLLGTFVKVRLESTGTRWPVGEKAAMPIFPEYP